MSWKRKKSIILSIGKVYKALRETCPNTEFFLVRIQSEYRRKRTKKYSVFGHFSRRETRNSFRREVYKEKRHCLSFLVDCQIYSLNATPLNITHRTLLCVVEYYSPRVNKFRYSTKAHKIFVYFFGIDHFWKVILYLKLPIHFRMIQTQIRLLWIVPVTALKLK